MPQAADFVLGSNRKALTLRLLAIVLSPTSGSLNSNCMASSSFLALFALAGPSPASFLNTSRCAFRPAIIFFCSTMSSACRSSPATESIPSRSSAAMSSEPSGVTNFFFRVVLDGGFRVARVDGGFGRGLFVRADRRGGVGKQVSAEIGDDSFRLLEGVGEVRGGGGVGK